MQNIFIAIIIIGVAIMFLEKTGLLSIILKNLKDISNSNTVDEVKKEENLPYSKKKYLLTVAENDFYKKLESVVAGRFYIFPQVNLDKIIVAEGSHSFRNPYHNKIDKKSVDYVLFEKTNISPVLVIELDDYTHKRIDRIERDDFVNSALEHCGIKYLRANNETKREEVESLINQL